ncbi:hypothetical protein [Microbacterium sp. EF45047]|uniref:hypothetical protein n=1 Tax=Microbacterium sp. EF45047 TaxID=2809708 RepID=UPI00234AFBA1|nr:hypothetical protein [Microbacterium sp. EF45047]WCM56364.1 hypothetical protein JRG78_03960 [Microbacterium sp. EF45047]
MSEQQPVYEWVFPPDRRRGRRRLWLIVLLSLLAVVIAGALFWMFLPKGDPAADPSPSPSSTATPTSSPSPTATAEPTPTATPAPEPEPTTVPSPPPPADPDMATFREHVRPRLDDALTGLDLAAGSSGQETVSIVDTLQNDAQWLFEAVAPASLGDSWREEVAAYSARLEDVRAAANEGGDVSGAVGAARDAVHSLRSAVGL